MTNKENYRSGKVQRPTTIYNERSSAADILAKLRRKSSRQILEEKIIDEVRVGIASPFLTASSQILDQRPELRPKDEEVTSPPSLEVTQPELLPEAEPVTPETIIFPDPHGYISQLRNSKFVTKIYSVELINSNRTDVLLELSDNNPCQVVMVSKSEVGSYLREFNAHHGITRAQTYNKLQELRILFIDTGDEVYSVFQKFEYGARKLLK